MIKERRTSYADVDERENEKALRAALESPPARTA